MGHPLDEPLAAAPCNHRHLSASVRSDITQLCEIYTECKKTRKYKKTSPNNNVVQLVAAFNMQSILVMEYTIESRLRRIICKVNLEYIVIEHFHVQLGLIIIPSERMSNDLIG
ncbi:hypothetical protein CEXT_97781 [Caerostris extrusa]|uniref:Uncharacterized protein n=1 Tax=Caerostris extrusa TaxID=172846 RepID=A0AAV4U4Y9_CAEEX|nr:hypothetical protein CEXT_97781 [Caerostris extrusa]